MENNKKGIWIVPTLIAIIIIVAVIILFRKKTEIVPVNNNTNSQSVVAEENDNVVYAEYSDGTTTVIATFYNDPKDFKNSTVTFTEPSIGNVTLPAAVSGSGARYANSDESVVFWEHQSEATIGKDGKDVFVGKIVKTTGQ